MDLDFGLCMTLLITAFIFSLIISRCLLGVVNRAFLVIDYAKAELMGKGKSGGKINIVGELFGMFKPQITDALQNFIGGKKPA